MLKCNLRAQFSLLRFCGSTSGESTETCEEFERSCTLRIRKPKHAALHSRLRGAAYDSKVILFFEEATLQPYSCYRRGTLRCLSHGGRSLPGIPLGRGPIGRTPHC